MATNSTMLKLGTKAPGFSLSDVVNEKLISLDDFNKKKALLVMFICNHCPYVVHVKDELAKLGKDYAGSELGIVAVSSNDAKNYPDDSQTKLKQMAQDLKLSYPLLYDESQETALSYSAACTPDFFLFDNNHLLAYRGQLDDSRPGNNSPVTGKDLRAAIDAVLGGKPVTSDQKPSSGCSIKWKPGNEPKY